MDITNNTQKKENVWLGVLGAFLFSLIGAVIFFILNAIGLIESISGFVTVFAAINGYIIFAKNESTKGLIISIIISALVIIVCWYLCLCITTVKQINEQASKLPANLKYKTTFAEFFPRGFEVIAKQPDILISLALSLAFGGLGYVSHANGLFYSDKSKKNGK